MDNLDVSVNVKNAEGDKDTEAQILVANQINYEPKVSVIIPVFNTECYLKECLESILNQDYKELEIICVDDGSTDNSVNILKEYAQRDKRITILTQQNRYAGIARNAGLTVAKGKYIHFVDSDDIVQKDFYKESIAKIEEYNVDFVGCSWNVKVEEGCTKRHKDEYSKIKLEGFRQLDENNKICFNVEVWNKLFRSDIIQKYNLRFPDTHYGEDASFMMQYIFVSESFYGIKEPLYVYRIRNDSIMGNIQKKQFDSYKALSYTVKFLNRSGLWHKNMFFVKKMENSFNWLKMNVFDYNEAMAYVKLFYEHAVSLVDEKYLTSSRLLYRLKKKKFRKVLRKIFPEHKRKFFSVKKYYDLHKLEIKLGNYVFYKNLHQRKVNTINKVNLAFLLDAQYFDCTYIAIVSAICSKLPTTHYDIYILYTGLTFRQQKMLLNLQTDNVNIYCRGVDVSKYDIFKQVNHITTTDLAKFDFPNVLSDLDKVLYIDGDVLIQQDLSDYFNVDLGENYIGATPEMQAMLLNLHKTVGVESYINGGVILFNLKKMREDNVSEKFIELKKCQPASWKCQVQDVLNKICDKKIHFTGVENNCTISIFIKRKWDINFINDFYGTKYKSLAELCKKAVILHFASDYKPWVYNLKVYNISKKYYNLVKHSLLEHKAVKLKKLKLPKKS